MSPLFQNLLSLKRNPHVSVPVIAAMACELGKIWVPSHAQQFDASQKLLLGYGIISAANTGPAQPDLAQAPKTQPAQTGNETK